MTKKTKGQELKSELIKQLGISSKKISVRYDGSYRITLKSWDVSKDEVMKIARSKESISRCEATGDILSGGNTFVFAEYDWNLEAPANAREIVIKAINSHSFNGFGQDWQRKEIVMEIAEEMGLNPLAAERVMRDKELTRMIQVAP